MQDLAETLGPLSKKKDKLLADHDELKARLNQEYEDLDKRKNSYQQEAIAIFGMNFKIKE